MRQTRHILVSGAQVVRREVLMHNPRLLAHSVRLDEPLAAHRHAHVPRGRLSSQNQRGRTVTYLEVRHFASKFRHFATELGEESPSPSEDGAAMEGYVATKRPENARAPCPTQSPDIASLPALRTHSTQAQTKPNAEATQVGETKLGNKKGTDVYTPTQKRLFVAYGRESRAASFVSVACPRGIVHF